MATIKPPENEQAPECQCGCGEQVNWRPGKGWSRFLKGHHWAVKPGNKSRPPRGEKPPLCRCGCGTPVNWNRIHGRWNFCIKEHAKAGHRATPETKKRQSEAMKRHYAGIRKRDSDPNSSEGNYGTHEYLEARARLVDGKPCQKCGAMENVHAHHEIPGDDESLIPLCIHCHPTAHAAPGAKGAKPPPGEKAPLCKCGCGQPVKWKRVRGWGQCLHGHATAKVPAGTRMQKAPLCGCGCGEPVKFTFGKGWNKYKRGHIQRVEGHYTQKAKWKQKQAAKK